MNTVMGLPQQTTVGTPTFSTDAFPDSVFDPLKRAIKIPVVFIELKVDNKMCLSMMIQALLPHSETPQEFCLTTKQRVCLAWSCS